MTDNDNKLVSTTGQARLGKTGRPIPPNAGKGRPAGVPNKATKELKEMILGALDAAGGQDYLQQQAENNPGPFLTLIGKVLPSTINATLGNPDGSPLTVTVNFKRPDEG